MAPFYEALCKSLEWPVDAELLGKMKKANEEELARLDHELEDAEKILGESEIRDAMMAKAEYLCRIGDKVREAPSVRPSPSPGGRWSGRAPVEGSGQQTPRRDGGKLWVPKRVAENGFVPSP